MLKLITTRQKAYAVLYWTQARYLVRDELQQFTRQKVSGFVLSSENDMPKGVYDHKPLGLRAERVTLNCHYCGVEFNLKASELRVRKIVKFCSKKCMGLAMRKPEAYVDRTCIQCGKVVTRHIVHIRGKVYCSKECTSTSRRDPNARWNDKAQIRQYMREYNVKNRDKHNARARQWNITNREKKASIRQARRANAKAGDFTADQWEDMKVYYNYTCLCCGKTEPTIKLSLDHIVPITRGGKHSEDNIQPLCSRCNSSKGAKTIDYRPYFDLTFREIKV